MQGAPGGPYGGGPRTVSLGRLRLLPLMSAGSVTTPTEQWLQRSRYA